MEAIARAPDPGDDDRIEELERRNGELEAKVIDLRNTLAVIHAVSNAED